MGELMHRVDWQDLRDVSQSAPVIYAMQAFALLFAGAIVSSSVPYPWSVCVKTYVIWMLPNLVVGLMVGARWWRTWLVGTLLLALGWLAACIWQLAALMEV
jgi:hypothetical protein